MGVDTSNYTGFMSRLARDQNGNILAMTAAAVIPMMGLVGGALDGARLYTVKSRLQAACDAGALAGRRVMGSGRWADNNGRPNTTAVRTFDLNFAQNFFGSENRARNFAEADGTVSGTASADVPMTLMRIFGIPTKTVAVSCEGQMRIPNTDVMFVLDNSGSMDQVISGDTTGLKKMAGLQRAIRCFYEALARENIDAVSPADCGTTSDPAGDLSSQVQLRFGFVNYDNMVNVGKLLPNNYMVDVGSYQSRTPTYDTVQTWTLGTQSATAWDPWSATPSGYANPTNYGAFTYLNASATLLDGVNYVKKASPTSVNACNALNSYGSYGMLGIQQTNGSTTTDPSVADIPVYPATTQTLTTAERRTQTVTYGFRYRYFQNGTGASAWGCYLERAPANTGANANKYLQSRSGTATKPITWTAYDRVTGWTYGRTDLNVSGLKAGGSNWNGSVSLPIGRVRRSVNLSGASSSTYIESPASTPVTWEGCIEERDTVKNTDGNPSDDWLSYPSSPANAFDMDIDLIPDQADQRTQWRPLLSNAVWGRKDTLTGTSWSGNLNNNPVVVPANTNSGDVTTRNVSSNSTCTLTPSRKLTNYNGQGGHQTAQDFSNYVGSIVKNHNTYHDIGLLWGARLMSPTGIFASENATTSGGAQIQRHMIFMTDGETANDQDNYASYGLEWWDRRQVDPTGLTSDQYEDLLEANNNARSNALCTAIKNKNITLWVIYYGTSDVATKTRLTNCATSPTYFFEAKSTLLLISKFREIADRIANLRLTQ